MDDNADKPCDTDPVFGYTSLLVAIGVITLIGVGGVALSPANTIPILGFCGLGLGTLVQMLQRVKSDVRQAETSRKQEVAVERVAVKAEEAAANVEEVKTSLDNKDAEVQDRLAEIGKTTDEVHVLVNSNMGAELQRVMWFAKRIAMMTKDTPEGPADAEVAKQAEEKYNEHEAKQAKVDAAKKPDAPKQQGS